MQIEDFFRACQKSTIGEYFTLDHIKKNKAFAAIQKKFVIDTETEILFFTGDCKIDDDLSLDYEYDKHPSEHCKAANDIRVIVIDGNLELSSSLINRSDEYGCTLIVAGSLKAENLILGGGACTVSGDVTVEKNSIFHFHSGTHEFLSGFTTEMLIESDYSFPVKAESEKQYYTDDEDFPIYKVIRAVLANQDFSEYLV